MDFDNILSTANSVLKTKFNSLKEKQMEALTAASQGHVMCILPTAYGKSLIMHLLPFLRYGQGIEPPPKAHSKLEDELPTVCDLPVMSSEHDTNCDAPMDETGSSTVPAVTCNNPATDSTVESAGFADAIMLPNLTGHCTESHRSQLTVHKPKIVVISPLSAIIGEQQERLGAHCITIDHEIVEHLQYGTTSPTIMRLKKGDYTYLIGHPEEVLRPHVLKLLKCTKDITHLVIDEAHVILSWGKSEFRKEFMKLHKLRTVVPGAKVLALTATATTEAQREIKSALQLGDVTIVKASPDRPNVYLEAKSRLPSSGGENNPKVSCMDIMHPLLTELCEKQLSFPKTIVYCSIELCGFIHEQANTILEQCGHHIPVQPVGATQVMSLIAQYHSPQTKEMKSLISISMRDHESNLRLLLATEAYGMGADAPNVRRIIHIGPPKTMETYIQEIGRCGRDGWPATATIYHNAMDRGSPIMQEQMRKYCITTKCRRKRLLRYLGFVKEPSDMCCDNCSRGPLLPCTKNEKKKGQVENTQVRRLLDAYFASENAKESSSMFAEVVTALSQSVIDEICQRPITSWNVNTLTTAFPEIRDDRLDHISNLLSSVISS